MVAHARARSPSEPHRVSLEAREGMCDAAHRKQEFPMPNRLDSMMSKGAGKVKGVKARLEGLVGVFSTLAEQHAEVKVLLKRLQAAPDRRGELWPEIRRDLLAHERAEIREVYPALRGHTETMALAEHHDEEAAEIEDLIMDIDEGERDWQALFDELVRVVQRHATEEEKEIFPTVQKVIGDAVARQLDARFRAVHRQIVTAV
jgi:hemerythrin superfamily protein